MNFRLSPPVLVLALAAAAAPAFAQAPAASPAPADSRPALVQEAPETKVPEAKIEHLVTEDTQVRIEETRVRGVSTRIVVKSKIRGMGTSYGIQPRDPSRYPQDDVNAGLASLNFGF
jgi:hypothetical protein